MRRHVLSAFAFGAALILCGKAEADCAVYRNKIDFKKEMLAQMLAESGQDCRVHFPLQEDVVIDVNEITARPHYGGVRVYGTSGAYYRSNPGYRGPDRFAFRFCGRNAGEPACATVRVKVDVR